MLLSQKLNDTELFCFFQIHINRLEQELQTFDHLGPEYSVIGETGRPQISRVIEVDRGKKVKPTKSFEFRMKMILIEDFHEYKQNMKNVISYLIA